MIEGYWLSISEVSKHINIPAETIRRYIRHHSKWLKLQKDGKRYLVHKESLNVIEKIRELYSSNYNLQGVEEKLLTLGFSVTVNVHERDDEHVMNEFDLIHELNQIKNALIYQQDFNQALIEKLDTQSNHFNQLENRIQERDEQHHLLLKTEDDKRDERMLDALEQHQKRIEQRLLERDQHLLRVIREVQEQKISMLESAVTKEKKEKKGFWLNLFKMNH